MAMRVLDEEEVEMFLMDCQKAEKMLDTRKQELENIYDMFERDLVLLGATVVEDRLQDKVAETIEALRNGDIKVWVLTGDKLETAESIGFASKLLTPEMEIMRCRNLDDV